MYPRNDLRPANGTLILVLGILSLTFCGIFTGIPAWVMGHNALRDIDAGYADPTERGLVQAGMICGIINVCLTCLAALFWFFLFFVVGFASTQVHPR
ncbi:MAG TPA: DUF4190 domain-containing protein [Fimbriimonadaceae bacterium]|nr:DUF4190 domain-containing protein [Fimbriimonadaceae bacterium]